MDALSSFIPSIQIILTAIAGGLATVLGTIFVQWNNRQKTKAIHDKAVDDMKLRIQLAQLATQAAEQLGTSNDERKDIALKLQGQWLQESDIPTPPDINLNEAHVATVVPVPMQSPDPTAKG